MIKIKDLANGYTIEYDGEGFGNCFSLRRGEEQVKTAKTQGELEEYLKKIIGADNKFKAPIKAFNISWRREVDIGVITSANIPDKSFWFTKDDIGKRDKQREKGLFDHGYYELTEKNEAIIKELQVTWLTIKEAEARVSQLTESFENQITAEFITARKDK